MKDQHKGGRESKILFENFGEGAGEMREVVGRGDGSEDESGIFRILNLESASSGRKITRSNRDQSRSSQVPARSHRLPKFFVL